MHHQERRDNILPYSREDADQRCSKDADEFDAYRWHSHFSSQYGNGIVGVMVVNGPATANYDIDLGPCEGVPLEASHSKHALTDSSQT